MRRREFFTLLLAPFVASVAWLLPKREAVWSGEWTDVGTPVFEQLPKFGKPYYDMTYVMPSEEFVWQDEPPLDEIRSEIRHRVSVKPTELWFPWNASDEEIAKAWKIVDAD